MSLLRPLHSPRVPRSRRLLGLALGLAAVTLVSCGHDQVTDPVVNLGPVLAGAPLPPVASYTMITPGPVAKSILTVDGSASSDPNAGGGITNYAWSWGDGTAVQNTGTTPKAVHAYQAPGTFTLGLTVTNTAALTNTATQSITVAARDTFTFSYAPTTPAAGQAISFTPVNAAPPAGDTSSYQWSFPGKVATQYSSLAAPTGITYDSAGTWSVRVQRSYRSGPRQIITQPITIGAALAPTGSVHCAAGLAADTVSNGSSVTCTPTLTANSGSLSTYAWTETGGTPASAATSSYAFTFNSGASLTPNLTATNTYGKSGSFSYTLTAAPPAGSISCSPAAVTNGTSVTCTSTGVSPGAGTLSTYAWSETGGTPASATTASYTFTWNTGASMTPTLTATNSYGKSQTFTATLVQPKTAPYMWAMATNGGCAGFMINAVRKYYCWGGNGGGIFGTGNTTTPASSDSLYAVTFGGRLFTSLSTSMSAITTTNTAFSWNQNFWGQAGTGSTNANGLVTITAISTKAVTTWSYIGDGEVPTRCGVAASPTAGKLYCWGNQQYGQVGNGVVTNTGVSSPTATSSALTTWSKVWSAGNKSCGLLTSGAAYCWGLNAAGSTGAGTTGGNTSVPTAVSTTNVAAWTELAVLGDPGGPNDGAVCGIASATGYVWCWGDDLQIQLRGGTNSNVPVSTGTRVFTRIVASYDSVCGISGNQVYCSGKNSQGTFGMGDQVAHFPWTLAFGGKFVTQIWSAFGSGGLCAQEQTTNVIYCAGGNNNGQLPVKMSSTLNILTPTAIAGQP